MGLVRFLFLFAALAVLASAGFAASPAQTPRDVAGYYWVYDNGSGAYTSVSKNPDAISILCPTWMGLRGSLGDVSAHEDPKFSEYAKAHGMKIIPLIADFDARTMHTVFSSIINRTRLATNIVKADSFSYCQGINLDFEGMRTEDRYSFDNFLVELAAKLKPKGYLLTIDVPSKSTDAPKSSWAGFCDYAEIGRSCDIVMIMTYDEHWSTGSPGPVASVQLDDVVLNYATSLMPKEKVFMGLAFYGYDWPAKGRAKSHRYTATAKILENKEIKLMWDKTAKVPWFNYKDAQGAPRTVYFENAASVAAKLKIAAKYDIGGTCMWSLGEEDPAIWDALRTFRKR